MKRCDTCCYPIERGGLEDTLYPVGELEICYWCLFRLKQRGYARIGKTRSHKDMVLFPDGRLITEEEFDRAVNNESLNKVEL